MRLKIALEEKEMDLRLRDRLLAEGKLKHNDVDAYLKNLQDDAGTFERITEGQEKAE